MSVRQAEEYVRKYVDLQNNPKPAAKAVELDPQAKLSIKEVETRLKKSLGSKVRIKPSGDASGKGRIVIDYKNPEDLDRLLEILG